MFRNDDFYGWSNTGFYLKRNAEFQIVKTKGSTTRVIGLLNWIWKVSWRLIREAENLISN